MSDNNSFWFEYIKSVKKIANKKIVTENKLQQKDKTKSSFKYLPYLEKEFYKPSVASSTNMIIDAKIDLHGFTKELAFKVLENFLRKSYNNNIKKVLVITGKGSSEKPSVIKLEVPRWLKYTELSRYIRSFSVAREKLGGEGAILVDLKNKAKGE